MDYNIPIFLKNLPQWVGFNTQYKDAKRPLDLSSEPMERGIYANELKSASSTDATTWAPFLLYEKRRAEHAITGPGFVFATGGEVAGLDLDHCVEDGSITHWAQNVIKLIDSYTEFSPSMTGVHIFVRGCLNIPAKRFTWTTSKESPEYQGLEVDCCKRYFRMTGLPVPGSPPTVEDRGRRLDMLLTKNADGVPVLATAARGFDENRNDAFMSIAGLLRSVGGYEEEDIYQCLSLINDTCNDGRAPDSEIQYLAHSAAKYQKNTTVKLKVAGEGLPITTANGTPKACSLNAEYLLSDSPGFGHLWFNEFDQAMYLNDALLSDHDIVTARRWLETTTLIPWPRLSMVSEALLGLGLRKSVHPVRDYLRGLVWDKTPRLDTWLSTYTREPDSITGAIGRLFLVSAVARIMIPGCEVRQVLLLTGPQDIGKSRLGAILAGDWFSSGLSMALSDKDAMQALWGNWVIEMPELSSMSKTTVEAAKAFISRSNDKFRAPYDRLVSSHARQCVIIATSNDDKPLKDRTGNTRFLPVHCTTPCDQLWLKANKDQLWAEAVAAFDEGEQWWSLPENICAELESRRESATEEDFWAELLRERFLEDAPPQINMGYVLSDWLNVPIDKQEPRLQSRVGAVIAALIRRGEIPYHKTQIELKKRRFNVWKRNKDAGLGKPQTPLPEEVI